MESTRQARTQLVAAAQSLGIPAAVADYIRDRIFNRDLKAGEPLLQEDLAVACGSSRVPVREALKQLQAEGLVEFRPRRGYVVAGLDLDEIADIFLVRQFIEGHAGYLAAQNRTTEDIAVLDELLDRMERCLAPRTLSVQQFAVCNREFHRKLAAASRRRQLIRILDNLSSQVELYVRFDARSPGRLREAQREHRAILKALRKGDPKVLGALCRAHVRHTADRILQTLRTPSQVRDRR